MIGRNGQAVLVQLLLCRLQDELYCIDMASIRGIRQTDQLVPQESAGGIVGWLPHEERQTPVYRFSTLLHREVNTSMQLGKILLFKAQASPWALLVDQVEGTLEVAPEDIYPLPRVARNPAADFFLGVVKYQEHMILLISPEGIQYQETPSLPGAVASAYTLETMYNTANIRAARVGGVGKLFVFTTSPERAILFGLSLSQIVQVLSPVPIMPIPCAADYMLGLAEWQGLPLAVIDLSKRTGNVSTTLGAQNRLLIVRALSEHVCVGIPIQPQVDIYQLPFDVPVCRRPVPLGNMFIRGQFALKDTALVIPDIERVVTPDTVTAPYRPSVKDI